MLAVTTSGTSAGSGGAIIFGNVQLKTAGSIGAVAIKYLMTDGGTNTKGDLAFSTRNFVADTALTERVRITGGGDVGIGTTAPEAKLQVTGGGLCVGSDANCNTDNDTEGIVYSSATAMTQYDVAENYPTRDTSIIPGEIVMIGGSGGAFVERANGSSKVLGIISPEPGVLLGGFASEQYKDEHQVAVALSGRIPVSVSLENGPIKRGDYLTLSKDIPGAAAKLVGSGQVIGIALQAYNGTPLAPIYDGQPTNQVMTFVTMFYHYDDAGVVRVFDTKIIDLQKQIDALRGRIESLEAWREKTGE